MFVSFVDIGLENKFRGAFVGVAVNDTLICILVFVF
jgi:hypothetical protein